MSEQFEVLIDNDKLMKRVKEMAEELDKEYAGKTVHLIGILKGSVFFMTDLAKNMKSDVTMDFISVSSYGDGTESSGIVRLNKDLDESIEGKNVVIVEDIVDSGRTLSYVRKLFEDRRPASLKIITLLDKPDRRAVDCKVEMSGFVIPDKFIIGYGLDYAQKYRNLPYIAVIN
ncbi:hypoxanthine phosphoribosyltransferase [Eubacterium sp.]|uniref:hypoxanthine phosphoribosyltransferase n=1 Tax=Eubacterium sp. TaxID=142586 RepID=UPI002585082B|nr:hypoxanthine phosphoribosyltransferase [Eubacterium sp.]MCR5368588.1 hypoxanthine phosphoribosyltransferase [Eubacterium sp.]